MNYPDGVEVTGPAGPRYEEILTPQALSLVAALQRELGPRRAELLAARVRRQAELQRRRPARTSWPRPPPSGPTGTGGSPRPRLAWSTGGSRSPARPTRR